MYIISRRFHVHFLLHTSSRASSIHHQLTAWHGHFHIYTAFLSSYDIALYLCTLSSSSTNKETLYIRGYLFICRLAKESLNLCDKTVLSSFIAVALILFGLSCSCMTVLLQRNFMYWSMTCYVQVSKHALIAGERSTWIAIAQYLHLRIHSFSRCPLRRGCCDDDVDDFDRRWNFCRQLESKASTHTFRSQLNYLYTTQWENR